MPSSQHPKAAPSRRDSGYVLISALWLLLLAGVLTAVILVQARERAQIVRDGGDALRLRHALASAIATVSADRLFAGPASQWWKQPAQGNLEIDGVKITLSLSNEAERIDLNRASRDAMAAALDRLSVEQSGIMNAARRDALLLGIEARRASGTPFYSAREAAALLATDSVSTPLVATDIGYSSDQDRHGPPPGLSEYFTIASGLETPRAAALDSLSSEPSQGDAIRIVACGQIGPNSSCATEVGRFALRPVAGWQRVDRWDATNK